MVEKLPYAEPYGRGEPMSLEAQQAMREEQAAHSARNRELGRCGFCYSKVDADGVCRVKGCRMVGSGFEPPPVWKEEKCDVCGVPTVHHRWERVPRCVARGVFNIGIVARHPECHLRRFHGTGR